MKLVISHRHASVPLHAGFGTCHSQGVGSQLLELGQDYITQHVGNVTPQADGLEPVDEQDDELIQGNNVVISRL